MAVFVMAVGILSLVALFPLGLRESVQGKQDLQQSMFADYALNQLVAAFSQTNLTWGLWNVMDGITLGAGSSDIIPKKVDDILDLNGAWTVSGKQMTRNHFRIFFNHLDEPSARIMGIGVRSTDIDYGSGSETWKLWTNNVLYYAEVMFQGNPSDSSK